MRLSDRRLVTILCILLLFGIGVVCTKADIGKAVLLILSFISGFFGGLSMQKDNNISG